MDKEKRKSNHSLVFTAVNRLLNEYIPKSHSHRSNLKSLKIILEGNSVKTMIKTSRSA